MSLQMYLGQIWTLEFIRLQGHVAQRCIQHYLHVVFLASLLFSPM